MQQPAIQPSVEQKAIEFAKKKKANELVERDIYVYGEGIGLVRSYPARPKWDDDSTTCQCCNATFDAELIEHHCRLCGSRVCDNCSKGRRNLPLLRIAIAPSEPIPRIGWSQRVCTKCVTVDISKKFGPLKHKVFFYANEQRRDMLPPKTKEVVLARSGNDNTGKKFYLVKSVNSNSPGRPLVAGRRIRYRRRTRRPGRGNVRTWVTGARRRTKQVSRTNCKRLQGEAKVRGKPQSFLKRKHRNRKKIGAGLNPRMSRKKT